MTSGTFNCKAAAAIQASANVIGRPLFSQPLLIRAHWSPLERYGTGAVPTKRPDQGHELFRPVRIEFGVGLQVLRADRRLEDNAGWKQYLVLSSLCPRRCFRSLRHLSSQSS